MEKLHTLKSSVSTLKQNTGQGIQTPQKGVVKISKNIEEFIKINAQGQKLQRQDLASSVHAKLWDGLPRVKTA